MQEQTLTISGWMIERLGLKGNELIVFAVYHQMSQAFTGGMNLLQMATKWASCSEEEVKKQTRSLIAKGLLVPCERGVCINEELLHSYIFVEGTSKPLPKKAKITWDVDTLDFIPNEFKDIVKMWLDYKKEKSQTYKTKSSLTVMVNNLIKLSGNNPSLAKAIVEQSIANTWSGLYGIKTQSNGRTNEEERRAAERAYLKDIVSGVL